MSAAAQTAADRARAAPAAARLRLTEIFYSLQGEARTVGWPTVFVRLTGCPLRCRYCDTTYAFHGGSWYTLDEISAQVRAHEPRYVTVTGGEPLAQPACRALLARLAEEGYEVSLETSGALDIGGIDPRVSVVMDLKTPGSGEVARNRYENIALLKPNDQVKFVICDRADYKWSRAQVIEHDLARRCEVLFSPAYGELAPGALADWILADRLPVRLQVQLHKILWGDVPGR
ncbi:MAG TPA: 7-carboxy-7-deazaguanine synthase QueE [Burkholderiales bacterium]